MYIIRCLGKVAGAQPHGLQHWEGASGEGAIYRLLTAHARRSPARTGVRDL